MRITQDTPTETRKHARRIRFEGRPAEPIPTSYTPHKGKRWVPDYAHAEWDHGKPIKKITLRGQILKLDGTPGRNRADAIFVTPSNTALRGVHPDAPAWLLELFADSPHTTPNK